MNKRRWSKRVITGPIRLVQPDMWGLFNSPFAAPSYKSSITIQYKYDGVIRKVNFLPVLNWSTGFAEAVPS